MTTKPGRNEPCHCGSGKKYKKCHLPKDQAAEREQRNWVAAAHFIQEDLLAFAQAAAEDSAAAAYAEALPLFWNGHYDADNVDEMAPDEGRIFFDWFVFDYQPEGMQRLIEGYRDAKWETLSSYQQQTLEEWLGAGPLSGYELTGYEGQTLFVRDIISAEEFEVYEPSGRGAMSEGDVILAHIVPVQARLEFSIDVPYIPAAEVKELPEKLKAAEEAYLEANPEADKEAFWRQHSYLLAQHALEQAVEVGRPPVARLDPNRPDKMPPQPVRRYVRR